MTRVFYVTFFFTFLPSSSLEAKPFEQALTLLESFSPSTSNITHIKYLLELSEQDASYESMVKLGEFWLLGYPLSHNNPSASGELVKDGHFNRNTDLALYYFKKALTKSKEAGFYISLILKQSLLIDSFAKYAPVTGVQISTINSLEEANIDRMSSMAIASAIFHYEKCRFSPKIPEFLNDPLSYINLPYYQFPQCGLGCEKLAYLAIAPATSALEFSMRSQKDRLPLKAISEDLGIYGEDMENLLKLYGKSALNNPEYMSVLGEYYLKGNLAQGIEPEIGTALDWLNKATAAGNMHAYESLGNIYHKGLGVEKNYTKAIELLNIAKEQGSILAHGLLGEMFLYGKGLPEDVEKGLILLKYAAKQGDLESSSTLGAYFFLQKEWTEALAHLEYAAGYEDPQSMYYLGIMKLQGLGTMKSCFEALLYLKKVIFHGELREYEEKGFRMFMLGDLEGAFLYSLVSASLGVENSLLSLGYLYEKNLVPDKYKCKKGNEYCAAVYYALAYYNPTALHKLGNLISKGSGFFKGNYTEAAYFYEKSSYLPESLFQIAMMNEYGLGIEKNLTKALEIYNYIIERADKGFVDNNAKYPAMLAVYRNKAKMHPMFQEILSFANGIYEIVESLFNNSNLF